MLFPLFPPSVKMRIFYLIKAFTSLCPWPEHALFGLVKALDNIHLSPPRSQLSKVLEHKNNFTGFTKTTLIITVSHGGKELNNISGNNP